MKLIVFDNGDPTVGIFGGKFEIECPFERQDVEESDLYFFKHSIGSIYAQFDSCSYTMYDFEIDIMDEHNLPTTNKTSIFV